MIHAKFYTTFLLYHPVHCITLYIVSPCTLYTAIWFTTSPYNRHNPLTWKGWKEEVLLSQCSLLSQCTCTYGLSSPDPSSPLMAYPHQTHPPHLWLIITRPILPTYGLSSPDPSSPLMAYPHQTHPPHLWLILTRPILPTYGLSSPDPSSPLMAYPHQTHPPHLRLILIRPILPALSSIDFPFSVTLNQVHQTRVLLRTFYKSMLQQFFGIGPLKHNQKHHLNTVTPPTLPQPLFFLNK